MMEWSCGSGPVAVEHNCTLLSIIIFRLTLSGHASVWGILEPNYSSLVGPDWPVNLNLLLTHQLLPHTQSKALWLVPLPPSSSTMATHYPEPDAPLHACSPVFCRSPLLGPFVYMPVLHLLIGFLKKTYNPRV